MVPERVVQEALEAGGDAATAFLWRRVCRDLDGDLRVGVAGRDDALVGRAVRALNDLEGVEWVSLRLEGEAGEVGPTLGTQDRLLGVHALLWVTPVSAPLGAEERAGMEAVVGAGAPDRRAVLLGDTNLLARMSDDPAAEAAEVAERARSLVGRDWRVLDEARSWIELARADRVTLARSRRRAVAHLLLDDALRRAREAEAAAEADLARVEGLLQAEEGALDDERRRGRRVAAHLLGAVRRQTEHLLLDLRSFLRELEADLPAQVDAVDLDVVRRTLPHWLHHVVEQWMGHRLARWRADLVADLADLELDAGDVDRAELLVPALHGKPLKHESGWTTRIGVTAAVGGGAALLAFGWWLPGLLAVTGGLAWSALGRKAAMAAHRRGLVDAAVEVVRQMATDAEHLLKEQIAALEAALDHLGDERAEVLAKTREAQRESLVGERAHREQRLRQQREQRAQLEERVAGLPEIAPPDGAGGPWTEDASVGPTS